MTTADRPQGYYVGSQTGDPASWQLFIRRELTRISQIINELAARSAQRLVEEPANPRVGQVVYAAPPWDPGSGEGLYGRTSSGWQPLTPGNLLQSGTALVALGNQSQATLRLGNLTPVTVVNTLRLVGGASGASPNLFVEGSDASIGLILATKGVGVGRLRHDSTDSLTWDSTRVDALKPLRLPSYTVALLPSPATHARSIVYVSNGTADKRLAISDGTNWRWPDGAIVT